MKAATTAGRGGGLALLLLFLLFLGVGLLRATPEKERLQRVFGSSPPMNYLLYALDKEALIGLNFPARNAYNAAGEAFLDPRFPALPVVGSFHGSGKKIDLEKLAALKPQLVLVWSDDMMVETIRTGMKKLGVPTREIPFSEISSIPAAFRLAGEAVGATERGETLARYAETAIGRVQKAVEGREPVRYYYAEGMDGLSTECEDSFHVAAFRFAGGENVHKCSQEKLRGMQKITFETLEAYDPEVIVVQSWPVYAEILEDPEWEKLRAVRNGRVHLVPSDPFNWLDRPPSFMGVLGVRWLGGLFHPDAFPRDLRPEIREFYALFLGVEPTETQIQNLLGETL